MLVAAREAAEELGFGLYLVGGALRDLLLGRSGPDMDLVVEGDALRLAEALAAKLGARAIFHRRFGTAKLHKGSLVMDLATARAESYAHPGALPTVRPGALKDDLFRRDFTINAMALGIAGDAAGAIVDPFDSRQDLAARLVRILHPQSFIDDATRIWRAVRYEQRLGFHIEAETERLLRRDVGMLKTISGPRLRREL
ncbi:MAG: CCA tRNA nucleotidyltransferase, partial [Chloroflexi bacterium]|nr:CCA tRNA nucleotidyltransferase [Chloroflexota bacterium]